jgi:3-deoxy-manno-octulosonate cytidylyltransferase (CMP-KDO synthetase)
MVVRVFEGARASRSLSGLIVATDSEEVLEVCRGRGIPAELTSPNHASGTDRIREIASRHDAEIFVNIQGDEPMVTGPHLDALLDPFRGASPAAVSTLAVPLEEGCAADPNTVKVVVRHDGRALYFSRADIPFDRDQRGVARWKHLGFYAYRREALETFPNLAPSALEAAERLEQLRFLENGIDIHVARAPSDTKSVDTAEDLAALEAFFSGR